MFDAFIRAVIDAIRNWLGHRIEHTVLATPPRVQLTPEEFAALDNEWKEIKKHARITLLACLVTVAVLTFVFLWLLALAVFPVVFNGEPTDYDSITRSFVMTFIFVGALSGLAAASYCEYRIERKAFLGREEWLTAYRVQKTGKNPVRQYIFGSILYCLLVPAALIATVSSGERIDASGLHWLSFPGRLHTAPYTRVKEIVMSERIEAPVGIVDASKLKVVLAEGECFEVNLGKGTSAAHRLQEVVRVVSEHSGVVPQTVETVSACR